nr:SDR family NAD(P)-dependent oxidoreductase [Rubellimicrobium sp. CFH 75288]
MTGAVAAVTGGAAGIGLGVARRLAASGARVTLWDRNPEALARAGIEGAQTDRVDVADWDAVRAATDRLRAREGRIDVLVNCAGIAGLNVPLDAYPLDEWDRVLRVNLYGTFHCCRAVVPVMRAQGSGRIVNFASMAGKDGNPNASAYSAAKAGVIALTKSLGKELARTGITVNVVAPAVIRTEMAEAVSPEQLAYMLEKIPMGRMGEVEEAAALVAWLASPEASFSTGAVFDLSGGRATY